MIMSNLMMFVIIVAIVVPGFFIVNRMAKTLYSENSNLNKKSKKRYGVQRFEEGLQKVKEKFQEEAAENDKSDEADLEKEDQKALKQ